MLNDLSAFSGVEGQAELHETVAVQFTFNAVKNLLTSEGFIVLGKTLSAAHEEQAFIPARIPDHAFEHLDERER